MVDQKKEKSATYRLLGVDPGTSLLGFAVIEIEGKNLRLVEMGVIHLSKLPSHEERLQRIFERLKQVIFQHKPREMAIEAPFYGKNAQSMLKLGRAQGVAIAAAMTSGMTIQEYSPRKIKQSVTGNGNASKEQVAAMLEQEFKIDLSNQLLDATDALGAAICHYYQSKHTTGSGKSYTGWDAFVKDNPSKLKNK
ncbi:MAG: crossover junction endodeoxyribonuclease RuvC [Bacteroidetes bacterium]|nr:MAG: crossover junction endodeoxyribonuclease RuvC [Bacteroidota bacterium]PTM14833.1 MAG: crossover junction endodeoxyribonuclease RuvC [Bacteroidota bacterium]